MDHAARAKCLCIEFCSQDENVLNKKKKKNARNIFK